MFKCYGDSITKGSPGVSYLWYMPKRRNYINLGLGGETLIGLDRRLSDDIEKNDKVDYLIQIGTNDILLPFLSSYSKEWRKRVDVIYRRGSIPCENEKRFEEIYTKMIKKFVITKRRIIIIGIPCIGEDLQSELNQRVDEYNRIIQKISSEFGADHIDFFSLQKSILRGKDIKDPYFISSNPNDMIKDVFLSLFKPFREKISISRDLHLTIDGCHLNDTGARALAELLDKAVNK